MEPAVRYFDSPVGVLEITSSSNQLTSILFAEEDKKPAVNVPAEPVILQCIRQLIEYFEGKRKNFDLNLQLTGTDFQKKVWKELLTIPYGETISYQQLAERTGDVKNIRASASANGKNNFVIVVPCHRVTGSDGKLTGYSGGLWRKEWLLEHEKKFSGGEYQTRLF